MISCDRIWSVYAVQDFARRVYPEEDITMTVIPSNNIKNVGLDYSLYVRYARSEDKTLQNLSLRPKPP